MLAKAPPMQHNLLIQNLPKAEQEKILACCELVELEFGTVLYEVHQTMSAVYFPLTGFISLVTSLSGHDPLEMGLIGNEGMLGVSLALGMVAAPMRAVVQGSGSALRMSSSKLLLRLQDTPHLRPQLNRYLYVLMLQLPQLAACAHFHEIGPRLARWLLMTHDRAPVDHFHLTHEFLASMLGVRRSGITLAAGALQEKKLISYSRGRIQILDRIGLEAEACECYDAVINDYASIMV